MVNVSVVDCDAGVGVGAGMVIEAPATDVVDPYEPFPFVFSPVPYPSFTPMPMLYDPAQENVMFNPFSPMSPMCMPPSLSGLFQE